MSDATLWIVWAVIGVIGGYMCGRLLRPERSFLLPVCSAVAGSLLGGWLYVEVFGMTDQNGYISLITSMILCAVFLWIYVSVSDRIFGRGADDD